MKAIIFLHSFLSLISANCHDLKGSGVDSFCLLYNLEFTIVLGWLPAKVIETPFYFAGGAGRIRFMVTIYGHYNIP